MTKKERIAAEIEKAKTKRQELNERIADLERRYKEEETLELHEIVRKAKLTPEQLEELKESLQAEPPNAQAALEPGIHSGFGMRNVDMRIRLYYRKKTGLIIQSGPEGTEVSFSIPIHTREEIDHDESLSRG